MDEQIKQRIQETIDSQPVVVFMKGTKHFPQCGFSATVVEVMKRLNVDFKDVNILTDPELRQGIKDFSNWPTIPQVYLDGKFIGGCDIVRDLYESGELEQLLSNRSTG